MALIVPVVKHISQIFLFESLSRYHESSVVHQIDPQFRLTMGVASA